MTSSVPFLSGLTIKNISIESITNQESEFLAYLIEHTNMTACEALTWDIDKPIDVPEVPISIGVGKEQLQDAEIKIHFMDGDVVYGTLISLDGSEKVIQYNSSMTKKVESINFEDCRYIFFMSELLYIGDGASNEYFPTEIVTCSHKQPYKIKFIDEDCRDGDSAHTSIDDVGIHIFKVVDKNYVARVFFPNDVIKDYDVGPQLGTLLKESDNITESDLEQGVEEQKKIRKKPLGEYLKDKGIVNDDDLERVLKKQKGDFDFPKVRLGELLIAEGLITEEELEEALGVQTTNRSRRLGDILIDIGATSQDAVHSALAKKLGLPFVKLKDFDINVEVLQFLSVDVAKKEQAMPLTICGKRLVIAIPDPTLSHIHQLLNFATNQAVELVVSTPQDIEWAINQYYGDNFDLNVHQIEADHSSAEEIKDHNTDLEQIANEKPIVRLVHNLLLESIKHEASDIHIRPVSNGVQVLFRIHGKLILIKSFGKNLLAAIVSRIKVIARMDIAQRRLPQDGRIQLSVEDEKIDMRVSTMPTVEGESVVIRILASAATLKPINEIGFNETDTSAFMELLHRGAGMILVTGPTGSGKSTTLYSALNILKSMNVNILTVEDPVEIRLDGLEQIQVLESIDLGFGRALRNILRHDPDVIMIGEIRDNETANIAMKAAQTGHLVLSTLHTNSAADTIVRLKEMSVEPYMIASSLLGIVAQRLISKNCDDCKIEEEISVPVRRLLGLGEDEKFYTGKGCDNCGNTGIVGRLPAYEFLQVTDSIQQNILTDASTLELKQTAASWGMQSIVECALKYARNGDTSIADVHRLFIS